MMLPEAEMVLKYNENVTFMTCSCGEMVMLMRPAPWKSTMVLAAIQRKLNYG